MEDQPIFDSNRQMEIAFVEVGGVLLELVEPGEGCTDIGEGLKRVGNMPYHVCFVCENLAEAIDDLEKSGCILVREPQRAVALGNRRVAFLYSGSLGLFEIVETD